MQNAENGRPVVWFVGAGPGDPDLITVKGLRLVEDAEVLIYAGSLVNPDLVARSRAGIKRDSMEMKLDEQVAEMARHAKEGKRVVRLHSGDPSLYGAIMEQIVPLEQEGVDVEIVPGVSSLFGVSATLGAQLTQRGISDTLIITRPAGKTLEQDLIRELSGFGATMAIFLGTEHLETVLAKVQYPPDTPAAIVYHATWPDQKIVRGTVADVAGKARDAGIERSALLVIGGVFDPAHTGLRRSYLYS